MRENEPLSITVKVEKQNLYPIQYTVFVEFLGFYFFDIILLIRNQLLLFFKSVIYLSFKLE